MSIKQILGVKTALNVTGLATLVAGGDTLSDELSLVSANVNGMALSVDIALSIAVPESNSVNVYVMGTNTSGNYGSVDDYTNLVGPIDGINMSETTAKRTIQIPVDILAPFFKLVFVNTCDNALTAASVDYISKTVYNA